MKEEDKLSTHFNARIPKILKEELEKKACEQMGRLSWRSLKISQESNILNLANSWRKERS